MARPQPASLQSLSLVELLDEVCDLAGDFLGRAVMWVDVAPPNLRVHADADQLRQAVLNLVTNAADRCRRMGRIVLKAELADEEGLLGDSEGVVISVLDEGPPVRPDLLDDLLAPPGAGVTKRSGYTLGLAIAQNVATEHGGIMVSLILPGGGVPAAHPQESGAAAARVISLLCVDGDPMLESILATMLEGTNCSCRVALSGEEALDMLGEQPVDVLLTSIRLSGMSGVELQHAVAQRDPALGRRTILIGGALRSTPAGVPTLPRPFSRLQLMRAVQGVMSER